MPFLILCIIIAMVVQLLVLFNLQEYHIKFRYISFFLMEIFPLGGALYYAIKQPSVPYLGWEFNSAMCLWMAGAVLLGYMLAWVIYALKSKK